MPVTFWGRDTRTPKATTDIYIEYMYVVYILHIYKTCVVMGTSIPHLCFL